MAQAEERQRSLECAKPGHNQGIEGSGFGPVLAMFEFAHSFFWLGNGTLVEGQFLLYSEVPLEGVEGIQQGTQIQVSDIGKCRVRFHPAHVICMQMNAF